MTEQNQIYARFRLSIDNAFRNEFSYIDYRKWGIVEVWACGRINGPPPIRQNAEDRIEVWFNWELVGTFTSYKAAKVKIAELLALAPVNLSDVQHYLEIDR